MSEVVHRPEIGRFELRVDNHVAELDYVLSGRDMAITHTGVPPELEGRGYGSKLAKAALEHARREHLRVRPHCSFVRTYIERHPEYASLVEEE